MLFIGCNRNRTNPYDPINFVKPIWIRTFGGSGNEHGNSVQQTSDGGYIIVATTDSVGVVCWLIKTDANGNKVWDNKVWDNRFDRRGVTVQQTLDGGYIIGGLTLIKTDPLGNKLWDKEFRYNDYQTYFGDCQQTSDGGYIVVSTFFYPYEYPNYKEDSDIWIIKTDANGEKVWDRTFGGNYYDGASSVIQVFDGGYVIVGQYQLAKDSRPNLWIIKTNSSGMRIWDKRLEEFSAGGWLPPFFISYVSDGGYIIGGTTHLGEGYEASLVKTDASGNKIWDRKFRYNKYGDRTGGPVYETPDGGYIMSGSMGYGPTMFREYDGFLVKTDVSGNTLWDIKFDEDGNTYFSGGCLTTDGCYVVTGYIYGAKGEDVLLMKIALEP